MTLTLELNLDRVKLHRHVRCLGQRSFSSKVIFLKHTHRADSLPGPLVVGKGMMQLRCRLYCIHEAIVDAIIPTGLAVLETNDNALRHGQNWS